MNLRITDEQTQRLRAQADAENRSMQSVAITAIEDYITRNQRTQQVIESSRRGTTYYREALDRLGRR